MGKYKDKEQKEENRMSNPKRAGRVCTALAVVLTAGSLAACSDGYKPKPLSENAVSLTAALNADAKAKE